MESSMRILRPLNLLRHFSPNFFPKSHSLTLRFQPHPRINPLNLSPISQYDAVFRSPTFPNFPNFRRLGILLSLSSSFNSPIHGVNSFNSVNFEASDGAVFHWHRAADPVAGAGAGYSGGGEREVAAVVLGWLGARPKHLKRYAEMYTSRGIDAVTFVVPVKDVLWFDLGRKVENRIRELADELVSWLSKGEGRKRCLIFHTFSNTGWLVYGAVLGHLQERPDLIERIGGCIVDSGGDPELNPKVWAAGFTAALVKKRNTTVYPLTKATKSNGDTKSSKVQDQDLLEAALLLVLEKIFSFLLKLPDVNQRLSKIISLLSENQPHCPQLYLYSTADKVIPFRAVESFIRQQQMKGRTVLSFNFGSSPHVDHYRTFPDVYTAQVNTFLNEILAMSK